MDPGHSVTQSHYSFSTLLPSCVPQIPLVLIPESPSFYAEGISYFHLLVST